MSAHKRIVLIAILALGLALRSYHYFREPSMWHDEAAVVVNVLSRGYADLLGPLTFHEAAPPLFLWLEKAVCVVLGDGVFALRLPAFLASCAALPLLAWAACRLLEPRAVPWAVFLFAVSDALSWHACEAKPYAFDVLAAVALVALYAATRAATLGRRLLLFALPAPLLILLSYPACFLYGGVLAATATAVWRERKPAAWAAYGLLACTVGGAFLLLLLGPIRAQHDSTIVSCWAGAFPDWDRPWTVPAWTLFSTLDVFRYCCKPLGPILLPLAAVGAVTLWRRGQSELVVMLAAPVLLALGAAFGHRYPFGGARVLVYATPAFVLLVGGGTPPAWDWLLRRHRLAPVGLILLFLPPLYYSISCVVQPWARADTAAACAYIEQHCMPDEEIAGNDWTHQYYLRRLGAAFHPAPLADAEGRCWVVYTEEAAADQRFAGAVSMGPAGWVMVDRREFAFTTVILLQRPDAKGNRLMGESAERNRAQGRP
ncbi:MAG TPA: hypothetical protein VMS17_27925 [Gemmataceae bacterium]|nr:hypothetical protein [Gemmataceae bacterium]